MTTSLTDRYIAATLRSLPKQQRPDIERELRASIADAVDGRLEAGIDAGDAEAQVLSELGDPARLVASYTDRPLHLIGPGLFPDYTRVLRVLLATVPPILLVVVGIVRVLNGDPPGAVARGAVVAVLTTALHIAFWTTLVFVVVERSPAMRRRLTRRWDPRSLPEVGDQRFLSAELVGGVVVATLGISLVVLSHTVGPVTDATGDPVGIVADALWRSGALYLFFLFFAASVTFHVVAVYVGWGVAYAIANALLSVLFAVPVVWLAATDRLLNDEFFTAVGWAQGSEVPTLATTIVIVGVISLSLTDAIDGFVRARRPTTRSTHESTRRPHGYPGQETTDEDDRPALP